MKKVVSPPDPPATRAIETCKRPEPARDEDIVLVRIDKVDYKKRSGYKY